MTVTTDMNWKNCRLQSMKHFFMLTAAVLIGGLLIGCGGSSSQPPTLIVQPASASASTNITFGTFQTVVLTATLNNNMAPTSVQWTTSDGCVAVASQIQNTATIACNLTCAGNPRTATITASAEGLRGTLPLLARGNSKSCVAVLRRKLWALVPRVVNRRLHSSAEILSEAKDLL